MNKTLKFSISIIIITVIISLMIIFFSSTTKQKTAVSSKDKYLLKAKDDVVALYLGEDIIKIYNGIIVSNLPAYDRELLETGIEFSDKSAAEIAAEDYDG